METVAQIATAVGALIGAGSLVAGFVLYRRTKRDAYAASLRQAIADSRANAAVLRGLLTYEVMNEISGAVVYSRDLELVTEQIYGGYFEPSAEAREESELKQFLDIHFPTITVPIRTRSVELAEARLAELARVIAPFQSDHPGLFRVVNGLGTLFRNSLDQIKAAVRDEKSWEKIIPSLHSGRVWKPAVRDALREQITSVHRFRAELHQVFVALLMDAVQEPRAVIGDVAELLDLVADAYLRQTEIGLERFAKGSPTELTPIAETGSVTDDLREAERALTSILSREEALSFREIVTRAEQRMSRT